MRSGVFRIDGGLRFVCLVARFSNFRIIWATTRALPSTHLMASSVSMKFSANLSAEGFRDYVTKCTITQFLMALAPGLRSGIGIGIAIVLTSGFD